MDGPANAKLFWPRSLLYEVTARCNLRCPHCYNIWEERGAAGELDTAAARTLVRRAIEENGTTDFTFTGGEPTLRPDLEELVAAAAALGARVTLITNGTLLPEARVVSLIAAGVSLFELPLSAADRPLHARLTGGVECFDRVVRAAADIRYHGADLAFVFVATRANVAEWRAVLELGLALGASGFLLNRYNAGGASRRTPEALLPAVDDLRAALAVAEEFASRYGLGIGAAVAIPPCLIDPAAFPHVGFGFCSAGTAEAYYTLDPVGRVRPCNHSTTVLGDLRDTPLEELAAAPVMARFMAARPAFCDDCALAERCLGGCKAAAEVCSGSLSAPEPFLAANLARAKKPPRSTGPPDPPR